MSRYIDSIIDTDVVIITIPELGYKIHYKLHQAVMVDAITKYEEDNYPDFITTTSLEFIKVEPLKNAKPRQESYDILKTLSIIPSSLKYDHILLGFVYSDKNDPNNHSWWLDFRNDKNQSVYNYFSKNIQLNCPLSTKSWHEGMWHGRFVINHKDIDKITDNNGIIIQGKNMEKSIGRPQLYFPPKTSKIKLYYNITENHWYCGLLNKNGKQLSTLPYNSISSDVTLKGDIDYSSGKPKVSLLCDIKYIAQFKPELDNLILRRI